MYQFRNVVLGWVLGITFFVGLNLNASAIWDNPTSRGLLAISHHDLNEVANELKRQSDGRLRFLDYHPHHGGGMFATIMVNQLQTKLSILNGHLLIFKSNHEKGREVIAEADYQAIKTAMGTFGSAADKLRAYSDRAGMTPEELKNDSGVLYECVSMIREGATKLQEIIDRNRKEAQQNEATEER